MRAESAVVFCPQTPLASGIYQYGFLGATSTLAVGMGEVLYAYIHLDPTNPLREVMLQWCEGTSWEHRACWGENLILWGTNHTNSRRYMGPLPLTSGWMRLEAPASQVGLAGWRLNGMAFLLYDGKATWDRAGTKTTADSGQQRVQDNSECRTTTDAGQQRMIRSQPRPLAQSIAG